MDQRNPGMEFFKKSPLFGEYFLLSWLLLNHWRIEFYSKCLSQSSRIMTKASQVTLVVKNSLANAGDIRDTNLIPGLGRSPGGRHGSPLLYSCLENPMDRRAWGQQSLGSQRLRHDWSNLARMHACRIMTVTIPQVLYLTCTRFITHSKNASLYKQNMVYADGGIVFSLNSWIQHG